jgi:hypothetical protein
MTITKGQRTHTIEKKINYLLGVFLSPTGAHAEITLCILNAAQVKKIISGEDRDKVGTPEYASFGGDFLWVHPIPNVDYKVRLLGSVIVEQ